MTLRLEEIEFLIKVYGVAAGRKNPQNKDDIDKFIVKFVQESIMVVTKIIGENEKKRLKKKLILYNHILDLVKWRRLKVEIPLTRKH